MIKRYSRDGDGHLCANDGGDLCLYSDVEHLQQERDALAARVERLHQAIDIIRTEKHATHTQKGSSFKERMEIWAKVHDLIDESPTTSLRAHDRELLLRLAENWPKGDYDQCTAENVGDFIRAKAEEL